MAAPQTEKGAEGIVPSAPLVSKAPESEVQEFTQRPGAQAPASAPSLHCGIDLIDTHLAPLAIVLNHRVATTFVGWIADDKNGVPRDIAVLLIGDGTYEIVGTTGLARADVAAATHKPAFIASGFSATGRPLIVPQGEYQLALMARFGSTRLLCPLNRTIAIK